MDMNTFNELTCGVNKQDPDYELYSSGWVKNWIDGAMTNSKMTLSIMTLSKMTIIIA